MAPPPRAPLPPAGALAAALRALPPRTAALLMHRLGPGCTREGCARFYGIGPRAAAVGVLRAALALAGQLGGAVREPPEAEEPAWAEALERHLSESGAEAPLPAALAPVGRLCRHLQRLAPAVQEALEEAERQEALSPRRRREDVLRRLAVVALLALAAYLYLARPPEAPPHRPGRIERRTP